MVISDGTTTLLIEVVDSNGNFVAPRALNEVDRASEVFIGRYLDPKPLEESLWKLVNTVVTRSRELSSIISSSLEEAKRIYALYKYLP